MLEYLESTSEGEEQLRHFEKHRIALYYRGARVKEKSRCPVPTSTRFLFIIKEPSIYPPSLLFCTWFRRSGIKIKLLAWVAMLATDAGVGSSFLTIRHCILLHSFLDVYSLCKIMRLTP